MSRTDNAEKTRARVRRFAHNHPPPPPIELVMDLGEVGNEKDENENGQQTHADDCRLAEFENVLLEPFFFKNVNYGEDQEDLRIVNKILDCQNRVVLQQALDKSQKNNQQED